MRDERGLYYHARAGDPRVRVYVRKGKGGDTEFRMWDADFPEVWEKHPWLTMDVIRQAAALHASERNAGAKPLLLYDEQVAASLLREEKS